ncbi:hypothetical protein LCGC14_2413400 [marine sediment metagenome]|uniref:Uncharacterized protein n=1 Tax=marine sediment metagenome TaxID=412755 RepID=A0A0F9EL68_9ZZZZ
MIRFKGGKISFRYKERPFDEPRYGVRSARVIEAIVSIGETFYVGEACCHPYLDNFCKEFGRKLALTRAIAQLDRHPYRTTIWKAYHGRNE